MNMGLPLRIHVCRQPLGIEPTLFEGNPLSDSLTPHSCVFDVYRKRQTADCDLAFDSALGSFIVSRRVDVCISMAGSVLGPFMVYLVHPWSAQCLIV